MTMRATLATALLATALLAGCAGQDLSPAPGATPATAEELDRMQVNRIDCDAGDDGACNRLWIFAQQHDVSGVYLEAAGTCGGRAPMHKTDEPMVQFPCPVGDRGAD